MGIWKPDPSFYPSPRLAAQVPPERFAYVAAFEVFSRVAGRPSSTSDHARWWRLLIGFVLLSMTPGNPLASSAWMWLAIAGLGVFHGINPAMGWLFAVALRLYRQSSRVVALSLVPIALVE